MEGRGEEGREGTTTSTPLFGMRIRVSEGTSKNHVWIKGK